MNKTREQTSTNWQQMLTGCQLKMALSTFANIQQYRDENGFSRQHFSLPNTPGILRSTEKHLCLASQFWSVTNHTSLRDSGYFLESEKSGKRQSTWTSQHCGATCDVCALCRQRTRRQIKECRKCQKKRCMPKCMLLFSLMAPAHTVRKNSKQRVPRQRH